MTDTWQSLLEQQATSNLADYSVSAPCFTLLTQLGVLHVSGDDAQSFLQNLFTNDVNALAINQGQLSGFCNPKGRLLALCVIIRRHDGYQLILPASMCATLQQRLSMYILRSKVIIADNSDETACIGLIPTANNKTIDSLPLPGEDYQACEQDGHFLLKYPSKQQHYLYLGSKEKAVELAKILLAQQWQLTANTIWQQLNIDAGSPMIFPESKEKFTPQQVNLDLINGVSFQKGCYPGQEVVARLHYLGKPSRRMFIAQAQTNSLPDIASEVFTDEGKVAGHIVCAQLGKQDSLQLLLSLKLAERSAPLFLDNSTPIIVVNNDIPE